MKYRINKRTGSRISKIGIAALSEILTIADQDSHAVRP